MLRRLAPDLFVFALALGVRLGFLFGVDEPLVYPYHLARALQIAAHPDPIGYVLDSDDWRAWGTAGSGGWTLAPLYYVFAAAVVGVFGPQLRPLQIIQCLLEALTAVGVSRLGRAVAGPPGVFAGAAYAVHWQAVVFHSGADTENLHTVLLVWGLALLADSSGRLTSAAGGLVLGLSALARGVALAFLPVAAIWKMWVLGGRRGLVRAALTLGCGLLAVLPWALRNYRVRGELVPIETVSVFNLWNDNAFVDEGRWGRQARLIDRQMSFEGKQREALHFALLGWRRDPGAGLGKIADGLEYFLRPSETHQLLIAEAPRPVWQDVLAIGLGDVLFALAIPLAVAFAAGGPRSPARPLLLLWMAYYLALLVVVFHTQVRYRTAFTPFLFACAAGGWRGLADAGPLRKRAALGLLAGFALVSWASASQSAAVGRAISSGFPLRSARAALLAGEPERAVELVGRAADRDPGSARPHVSHGRWLVDAGRAAEAVDAYGRALATKPSAWLPRVVLPRLLADVGRHEDAKRALAEAHGFSRGGNPWLALEAAWRELPPPRTNEILVGGLDYGAVRGFMGPEPGYRWSRARAWLRLRPKESASRYAVTLEMGSPEPSPLESPEVMVRVDDGPWTRFVMERQVRSYRLEAPAPTNGTLVIELRSPTWTRAGLTPELGVRVDRLAVEPLR